MAHHNFFHFCYENPLTRKKRLCTSKPRLHFATNLVATACKLLNISIINYCFYYKNLHWLKNNQFVWIPLFKGIVHRTNKLPTKLSTGFVDTFDEPLAHFYGAMNRPMRESTVSVCSLCNQCPAFLTVTTLRAPNKCAKSCFMVFGT